MRLSRIIGLQKPIMRQIHWCLKTEKENPIYFLKWCRINCFSECKRLFFILFFFLNVMISVAPSAVHCRKYPEEYLVKHIFLLKIGIGEKWAVGLTQDSKEGAPLLQAWWWRSYRAVVIILPHPAMMEGIFWAHSSLLLPILQGYRRRRKKNREIEGKRRRGGRRRRRSRKRRSRKRLLQPMWSSC